MFHELKKLLRIKKGLRIAFYNNAGKVLIRSTKEYDNRLFPGRAVCISERSSIRCKKRIVIEKAELKRGRRMELNKKKALIIGASRGIGEAVATAYAREGADVVLVGRNVEALKIVKEKVLRFGGKAYCLEWDIREVSRADEVMKTSSELLGGLDIVVNNAGVIEREQFLSVREEAWDTVMDINVKGVYFSCQAVANYFIKNGVKGKIINMASETGFQPSAMPYGISKWAVVGFSMGMAKHLFRHGVILSSIAPGPIATDMMCWKEGSSKNFPNCFGTMGSPEEVADLAVFLASDKNQRIIGRPVFVSGGLDW